MHLIRMIFKKDSAQVLERLGHLTAKDDFTQGIYCPWIAVEEEKTAIYLGLGENI